MNKHLCKIFSVMSLVAIFSGCGKSLNLDVPALGIVADDGVVVKSRAIFEISSGPQALSFLEKMLNQILTTAVAAAGSQSITVVSSPSSSMTVSNTNFVIPTITNALLDFGNLKITALADNNLKVCGTNGSTKCGTALIRMYTTGTVGAGIYNADDSFGAPITAGQSSLTSVGLGASNATTMQSVSIPSSKHTMVLSDFTNPIYNIKADFTLAGAGTYSTTLIIEYGLAL